MELGAEREEEQSPDIEWLQLVLMARQIGLTPDDIRLFLRQNQVELNR